MSEASPNMRFQRASYAFADMLRKYMEDTHCSNRDLFIKLKSRGVFSEVENRINASLPAEKHHRTKDFNENVVSQWKNGEYLPEQICVGAIADLLRDTVSDLSRAHSLVKQSVPTELVNLSRPPTSWRGYKMKRRKRATWSEPNDWRIKLCESHLKVLFNEPTWQEMLVSLLLNMPRNARHLLKFKQTSFGRYQFYNFRGDDLIETKPWRVVDDYSSGKDESAGLIAVEIEIGAGYGCYHQDHFPGFEYGVVYSGSGVCFVGNDEDAKTITAYPLGPGSAIGFGARLPHLVIATDEESLRCHHIVFPYRKSDSTSIGPSFFDCREVKQVRKYAAKLSKAANRLCREYPFTATPEHLRHIFQDQDLVRVNTDFI